MKRNFAQKLKNFNDEDVKEDGNFVTMKDLAKVAIGVSDQKECTAEEKWRKFELSIKIHNSDVVELSSEDVALLKDVASRSLSTLGYGRFREFLETDYTDCVETEEVKND